MKRLTLPRLALLALALAACSQPPLTGRPGTGFAPQSFGSAGFDAAFGLAAHHMGVYVVGGTSGELDGPQAGELDAFVRKYGKHGTVLWADQFGTDTLDFAWSAASDARDNAYVVGGTYGSLGGPYSGNDDTFVRKYSPAGKVLWTRQFGAGYFDYPAQVAVSGENVYVVGTVNPYTADADGFVKTFSSSGDERWTRLIRTSSTDIVRDVAVDRWGNAYVVGYTRGELEVPEKAVGGFYDLFVRKYTPAGDVAWTRQLDYDYVDIATAVAVNGTDVYLAGLTQPPNAGNTTDALVVKLSTSGLPLWAETFDLRTHDEVHDISAFGQGVVFAGRTTTDFYLGQDDGFVYKLNRKGNDLWHKTLGTAARDETYAVLATPHGVFAAGSTEGVLGAERRGEGDAYLARLRGSDGETLWLDQ